MGRSVIFGLRAVSEGVSPEERSFMPHIIVQLLHHGALLLPDLFFLASDYSPWLLHNPNFIPPFLELILTVLDPPSKQYDDRIVESAVEALRGLMYNCSHSTVAQQESTMKALSRQMGGNSSDGDVAPQLIHRLMPIIPNQPLAIQAPLIEIVVANLDSLVSEQQVLVLRSILNPLSMTVC